MPTFMSSLYGVLPPLPNQAVQTSYFGSIITSQPLKTFGNIWLDTAEELYRCLISSLHYSVTTATPSPTPTSPSKLYSHRKGMSVSKVGRPQMYTPEQIQDIADDLGEYIETTEDPTIVGFTSAYSKYSVNKDYISDHEEFSELRKKAIEKQEAYLLRGSTTNKLNATVAIFRLKQPQHGYKDKVEQDITTGGEKIQGAPLTGDVITSFINQVKADVDNTARSDS